MPVLVDVLESRADAALRRADALAGALRSATSPAVQVQIDLEQALDDADRYTRLLDRLGAAEARGTTTGPYRFGGPYSFIGDLIDGGPDALERLNQCRRDTERRAATLTLERRDIGSTALSGIVPPHYMLDAAAESINAGRPLVEWLGVRPLPDDGLTVEMSRFTTGTTAGAQAAEGAATATGDPVAAALSVPVRTVAVRAVLSRQAYQRARPGVEVGLIADMTAQLNATIGNLAINGTGTAGQPTGFLTQASTTSTVYADATPTGAELLPKLGATASAASVARKLPIEAFVMNSRRWWWLASRGEAAVIAAIGNHTILGGTPVILDDNIPTNLGTGVDEDRVLALRRDDHRFHESAPYLLTDQGKGAANGAITLVLYKYVAFTCGRYPTGIGVLSGSGLNAVAS